MMALRFTSLLGLAALTGAGAAYGQANPNNSAQNAYVGSIQAVPLSPDVKKLSLDDAIQLGIANNLALTLARENQKQAAAQRLQLVNALLPNVSAHAERATHQLNLEAEGFNTALFESFLPALGLPASEVSSFPLVATVDETVGQLNVSQALFTWSGWDVWKAAKSNEKAAYYNTQSSRGLVVLNVGTDYLKALQASAQVDYAQALLKTDERLLYQAHEEHVAGTAANLDELRARVQYQTQQQTLIADQNAFEKAKVALNREIGLDPAQPIELTDATPYSDLATINIEEARQKAFANRQDFQSMRAQMLTAHLEKQATKHERYPSLSFTGNYGVTGVTGEVYHGTFTAMGTLSIPIFKEATFRGDHDVAVAQEEELQTQFHDLEAKIDQQLRDSLLDLKTDAELVSVAKSNLELATTELDQTTDRFKAGVDDNLPVTQAQSTLAQAQTQYVNSVFQFNQAKLGLARNLGIIDTQYRNYVPQNSAVPPSGNKK